MSDKDTTTPESEVNETPEETVNDEQQTEETIGDTLGDDTVEEPQKGSDTIPKARLDKEIQRRKDLEAKVAELESGTDSTGPESETTLAQVAEELAELKGREAAAQKAVAIEGILNKALDEAPEYAGLINRDLMIREMTNPVNKDKTATQLLDEVYGNTLPGKRTVETSTPRGGAKDTKVDMTRAQRDSVYRKEVLADPELRKQYNEADGGIENRIRL